jgi:3-hydroxyisobutyrate dehydrogenase-like beta-hydroxyacid dehydrogenase
MGLSMCGHVLAKSYPVTVSTRTKSRAQPLLDKGAAWAGTPGEVGAASDIVFTIVGFPSDVREVYFGADGLLSRTRAGQIFVDMTTTEPQIAKEIDEAARKKGAAGIDAPVSGGDVGAHNGTLSIMVGGDAAAFAAAKPILDVMGNPEKVVHVGDSGAGQLCKLCNQMVIGGTLVVVAEALALARKAGVDAGKVREALLGGFAQSRVLEVHGERALKGTFKPGFKTHLYAKDMRNVVATLAEQNVAAPVTAVVQQLLHATMAAGHGEDDNSVMAKTVFELAGLD